MDPTAVNQTAMNVAIGGLVMGITQSIKRWTPEGWGPLIAAIITTLAVVVWLFSQPSFPPSRTEAFGILAVWSSVFTSALGLYGVANLVTSGKPVGTGDGSVLPVTMTPKEPKPKRTRKPKPAAVLTAPVTAMPSGKG